MLYKTYGRKRYVYIQKEHIEQTGTHISLTELHKFCDSDIVTCQLSQLNNIDSKCHISNAAFKSVRNTIMLCVEIYNARGAGEFYNTTVAQFDKGYTTTEKTDDYVVIVKQQKTTSS